MNSYACINFQHEQRIVDGLQGEDELQGFGRMHQTMSKTSCDPANSSQIFYNSPTLRCSRYSMVPICPHCYGDRPLQWVPAATGTRMAPTPVRFSQSILLGQGRWCSKKVWCSEAYRKKWQDYTNGNALYVMSSYCLIFTYTFMNKSHLIKIYLFYLKEQENEKNLQQILKFLLSTQNNLNHILQIKKNQYSIFYVSYENLL